MVNYRRVLCEVALLSVFVALAACAPKPDCGHKHYDQRQNGSENYRINIDGVFVAVAPAESVFSALGDMDDLMDLLSIEDFTGDHKPKPPSSSSSSPSLTISSLPSSEEADKPQEKPAPQKPTEEKPSEPIKEKPQEVAKPEAPAKPADLSPLSDVSLNDDLNVQKKEASTKKQEKGKRLKNRLAAFLLPLLKKARFISK